MYKFQNLKPIEGDASFRKFFRNKFKNKSSIVVFAKREKFKNLVVYDAINKILNKNKILAPNLYKENYKKGYIEIQDFGDNTIFKILLKKKDNKVKYYKKILKTLMQIQSIKNKGIKDFKKKKYIIPKYDKLILLREAQLFCDWYVKKKLIKKNRDEFNKNFKRITKKLVSNLQLKNNVFVHRDFHISNLMLVNNRIGVIDSQDALIGNKAYDLASLVDDVRLKTPIKFKNKIYIYYIDRQHNLNKSKFKNDYDILSVMRNLKIIGIFTRLAIRDGKKSYSKLIPRAWEIIRIRINNQIFSELKKLLNQNFKKELNAN